MAALATRLELVAAVTAKPISTSFSILSGIVTCTAADAQKNSEELKLTAANDSYDERSSVVSPDPDGSHNWGNPLNHSIDHAKNLTYTRSLPGEEFL
ncbi:hypothetical protein H7171_03780 [Candidatus Saccharibacteria bacterium]|nr:hypothetical protein [Candidatus Saccharibacteria bacterium]